MFTNPNIGEINADGGADGVIGPTQNIKKKTVENGWFHIHTLYNNDLLLKYCDIRPGWSCKLWVNAGN